MSKTFIKLSRCLMHNVVFDNEKLLKVWIWCLLKASYKERSKQVGMQTVLLQPGQFIFGRHTAAEELGFSESFVFRAMKNLEKLEKVNIKANNKFSLVTIVNWALYQGEYGDDEQQDEQQMNNKRTINEQQMNTNNKVNKGNKEKKDIESMVIAYTNNQDLIDAINDFIENRRKTKAPMETKRAMTTFLNKLDSLADNDADKIDLINTAVMNNWKSVFADQRKTQPQQRQRPSDGLEVFRG